MRTQLRAAYDWSVETYLLFVVAGLVVGAAIAPVAMQATGGPDGTVAVIQVQGSIDGEQATRYRADMRRARQEADAVVVVVNSGGGSASASEAMYLQTKRTAEEVPVVASVDAAAASGAYFTIAPADHIVVKPASLVGSVGVLSTTPPEVEPTDQVATSGPDKLTGGSGRGFFYQLRTVQRAFLNAVFEQRGDRIRISRTEVARGSLFVGSNAVRLGLADEVGDQEQAVATAAARAGLDRPRVVVLGPEDAERTFFLRSAYLASAAEDKRMIDPGRYTDRRTGVPTFMMVPAGLLGEDAPVVSAAGDAPGGTAAPNASTTDGGADATGGVADG
jgi:protease-4